MSSAQTMTNRAARDEAVLHHDEEPTFDESSIGDNNSTCSGNACLLWSVGLLSAAALTGGAVTAGACLLSNKGGGDEPAATPIAPNPFLYSTCRVYASQTDAALCAVPGEWDGLKPAAADLKCYHPNTGTTDKDGGPATPPETADQCSREVCCAAAVVVAQPVVAPVSKPKVVEEVEDERDDTARALAMPAPSGSLEEVLANSRVAQQMGRLAREGLAAYLERLTRMISSRPLTDRKYPVSEDERQLLGLSKAEHSAKYRYDSLVYPDANIVRTVLENASCFETTKTPKKAMEKMRALIGAEGLEPVHDPRLFRAVGIEGDSIRTYLGTAFYEPGAPGEKGKYRVPSAFADVQGFECRPCAEYLTRKKRNAKEAFERKVAVDVVRRNSKEAFDEAKRRWNAFKDLNAQTASVQKLQKLRVDAAGVVSAIQAIGNRERQNLLKELKKLSRPDEEAYDFGEAIVPGSGSLALFEEGNKQKAIEAYKKFKKNLYDNLKAFAMPPHELASEGLWLPRMDPNWNNWLKKNETSLLWLQFLAGDDTAHDVHHGLEGNDKAAFPLMIPIFHGIYHANARLGDTDPLKDAPQRYEVRHWGPRLNGGNPEQRQLVLGAKQDPFLEMLEAVVTTLGRLHHKSAAGLSAKQRAVQVFEQYLSLRHPLNARNEPSLFELYAQFDATEGGDASVLTNRRAQIRDPATGAVASYSAGNNHSVVGPTFLDLANIKAMMLQGLDTSHFQLLLKDLTTVSAADKVLSALAGEDLGRSGNHPEKTVLAAILQKESDATEIMPLWSPAEMTAPKVPGSNGTKRYELRYEAAPAEQGAFRRSWYDTVTGYNADPLAHVDEPFFDAQSVSADSSTTDRTTRDKFLLPGLIGDGNAGAEPVLEPQPQLATLRNMSVTLQKLTDAATDSDGGAWFREYQSARRPAGKDAPPQGSAAADKDSSRGESSPEYFGTPVSDDSPRLYKMDLRGVRPAVLLEQLGLMAQEFSGKGNKLGDKISGGAFAAGGSFERVKKEADAATGKQVETRGVLRALEAKIGAQVLRRTDALRGKDSLGLLKHTAQFVLNSATDKASKDYKANAGIIPEEKARDIWAAFVERNFTPALEQLANWKPADAGGSADHTGSDEWPEVKRDFAAATSPDESSEVKSFCGSVFQFLVKQGVEKSEKKD